MLCDMDSHIIHEKKEAALIPCKISAKLRILLHDYIQRYVK
jgi:hypothetical protein